MRQCRLIHPDQVKQLEAMQAAALTVSLATLLADLGEDLNRNILLTCVVGLREMVSSTTTDDPDFVDEVVGCYLAMRLQEEKELAANVEAIKRFAAMQAREKEHEREANDATLNTLLNNFLNSAGCVAAGEASATCLAPLQQGQSTTAPATDQPMAAQPATPATAQPGSPGADRLAVAPGRYVASTANFNKDALASPHASGAVQNAWLQLQQAAAQVVVGPDGQVQSAAISWSYAGAPNPPDPCYTSRLAYDAELQPARIYGYLAQDIAGVVKGELPQGTYYVEITGGAKCVAPGMPNGSSPQGMRIYLSSDQAGSVLWCLDDREYPAASCRSGKPLAILARAAS